MILALLLALLATLSIPEAPPTSFFGFSKFSSCVSVVQIHIQTFSNDSLLIQENYEFANSDMDLNSSTETNDWNFMSPNQIQIDSNNLVGLSIDSRNSLMIQESKIHINFSTATILSYFYGQI